MGRVGGGRMAVMLNLFQHLMRFRNKSGMTFEVEFFRWFKK